MPGRGERKLPAPRAYIAIIALFATLHLISDAGMERGASVAAWVTVLVGMIRGPFGNKLTGLINQIAPPGQGVQPLQPIPPDTSSAG